MLQAVIRQQQKRNFLAESPAGGDNPAGGDHRMDLAEIDLVIDWLDFIEEWLAAKQHPETSHIIGVAKLSLEDVRQKLVTDIAA